MKFYKFLCQFIKIRHRRTALDKPLYKLSAGRSMVEMLGVLAIIGVLSVGAIAGYSKAMMKYKLNKQAEAMNMLFINAFEISHKIANTSAGGSPMHFAETLYKLNLLPDGITRLNTTYLNDIFKNNIWVYAYPDLYGIGYKFNYNDTGNSNTYGAEICRNLFNVYKENAGILYYIESQVHTQTEEGDKEYSKNNFYGNNYCNNSPNKKCISKMTLDDIDILCNSCLKNGTDCNIYALWK